MSGRPSTSSTAHTAPSAPTVPPPVHALASPLPVLIDAQLPGYLLPGVIDALRASTENTVRRRRRQEAELRERGALPGSVSSLSVADLKLDGRAEGKGKGRADGEADEEEARLVRDELERRLERIGAMVGGYIAEKLTLARPPLASHLDIIKFVCKDLFLYVYSKQIDNLRTNHRGIFVLQSNSFPPLVPLSSYRGAAADMDAARIHLVYPQALLQGALQRLGMPALVTAESSALPQCTFQIRTVKSTQAAPTSAAGTPITPGTGTAPQAQTQSQAPIPAGRMGPPPVPASTGLGIAGTS